MPRYTALQPIDHDGKRVEPPGSLELTKDQAAPLLALKHIELKAGRDRPPAGAESDPSTDEKADGQSTTPAGDQANAPAGETGESAQA